MGDEKIDTVAERLKGLTARRKRGSSLSEQEGIEAIRAYRRGVAVHAIDEALGRAGHRSGFYMHVGMWALRFAKID